MNPNFPAPTPSMRSLLLAVTAFLLALPASAQERVRLTFDWPAGLTGEVTETVEQTQSVMGMTNTQRTVTRRPIETEDRADGTLIRYFRGELVEASAPAMGAIEGGDEFTRLVAEAPYDMIVADDGTLVEISRDPATIDSLRAGLEALLEPMRGMPEMEAMASMFEGMIGGDALNAAIEQNWDSSIALWAGDEVQLGETFVSETEAPFPLMDNRTLVMEMATTVTERLACVEGGAPDGCIRIVVESAVDPADFRPMMEEMMGEMLANLPADMSVEFGEIDQATRIEAIVEPGTLIPHRVILSSGGDIEMIMMGQAMATTQEMVVTTTYDWRGR